MKKILNNKGESLVETLTAILIFTLSSIMLYSMLTTSIELNRTAKEADETHQQQMIYAERGEHAVGDEDLTAGETANGFVSIHLMGDNPTEKQLILSYTVNIFRQNEDALYSYGKEGAS